MGGNYHQPSFPLNWHFLYLFMSLPALPYLAMISWCPNIQGSAQETVGIINVEALIRHLGAHSVGSLALSCRVWTGWSRTFSATLIFFARRRKNHWNCRPFSHSKPRKYTYTYTYAYIYISIYSPGNTEASIASRDQTLSQSQWITVDHVGNTTGDSPSQPMMI